MIFLVNHCHGFGLISNLRTKIFYDEPDKKIDSVLGAEGRGGNIIYIN